MPQMGGGVGVGGGGGGGAGGGGGGGRGGGGMKGGKFITFFTSISQNFPAERYQLYTFGGGHFFAGVKSSQIIVSSLQMYIGEIDGSGNINIFLVLRLQNGPL